MSEIEPLREVIDALDALRKVAEKQTTRLDRLAAVAARQEWRELLRAIPDAQRLEHFGFKIYSQNDEDGILQEMFRRLRLGPSSGVFVEIGASQGLENNTHFLLRQGYRGVWFESSETSVAKVRRHFGDYIADGRLAVQQVFMTAENVDESTAAAVAEQPVAVLSIDVDGNDYWLWKALARVRPTVVVVEYNGKFPPPLAIVQRYQPDHVWKGTDYFGASLAALDKLARAKGYRLVGCNITGANAFFVRQEFVHDAFPYDHTAESLYQPCRYHLTHDCFAIFGYKSDVGPFEFV